MCEMNYDGVANMPGNINEILHYGRHFDLTIYDARIVKYVADLMIKDQHRSLQSAAAAASSVAAVEAARETFRSESLASRQ